MNLDLIEVRRCANGYVARARLTVYKQLPMGEEFCFTSIDELLGWIRRTLEPKEADPRQRLLPSSHGERLG